MILIGLGSNLAGPWGAPEDTVRRALASLDDAGCTLVAASPLVETAPFGKTDQPNFVNAVARIRTRLEPGNLLIRLNEMETAAGRVRAEKWGPRTLDLDILDYEGMVLNGPSLILPHPGIAARRFVLEAIVHIAPMWRHPVLGLTAGELLRRLGPG